MIYTILLTDRRNGRMEEITAKSSSMVEELSARIKVALRLPYTDDGWHRFVKYGITYVIDEHVELESNFLEEHHIHSGPYRGSERTPLSHLFTTLQSVILYEQDEAYSTIKVDCTLIKRSA